MASSEVQFRARIAIIGINPYVPVSGRLARLIKPDWRKPMPVLVRINDGDQHWRINLMPIGDGRFYLYLHGGIRKASGIGVGDRVLVRLIFNQHYRGGPEQPIPDWFATELAANFAAARGWRALTPSRQKEIVRYFARLKSDAARRRNAERALHVLAGGRGRFMARPWNVAAGK